MISTNGKFARLSIFVIVLFLLASIVLTFGTVSADRSYHAVVQAQATNDTLQTQVWQSLTQTAEAAHTAATPNPTATYNQVLYSAVNQLTATANPQTLDDTHEKMAFTSTRDGNAEIYVMDVDGSHQYNLTRNAADDDDPVWSPDGTKIAFDSNRDGNSEVYVMNADGSDPVDLSNTPDAYDGDPSWSPDGTKIAFDSDRDGGKSQIYVMNADGSAQVNLTNDPSGADLVPKWSPDGSKIAFTSTRNSNVAEIFVMDVDGSDQTTLQAGPGSYFNIPSGWTPDGAEVAYYSYDTMMKRYHPSDALIMIGGPAEAAYIMFGDITVGADYFIWSPDGSQLAYVEHIGDHTQIFVGNVQYSKLKADGFGNPPVTDLDPKDTLRLTDSSGDNRNPVWRP